MLFTSPVASEIWNSIFSPEDKVAVWCYLSEAVGLWPAAFIYPLNGGEEQTAPILNFKN
jgi:hypothetical protein